MQQPIVEYILVSQIVEELVEAFKVFSQHSGGGRKIIKRTVQRKRPIIQEKINQVTMNVEISQIQYIDKVVDVLGVMQKQVPAIQKVQKTVEVPLVQLIDKVVDLLVVLQRQVPMIQKVQKAVEGPQVQYIDKIVDVPVVWQRQGSTIQTVQKTVEAPQVQFLGRVLDVPVVMRYRKPWKFRRCSFLIRWSTFRMWGSDRFPPSRGCRKRLKRRRCSSSTRWWMCQS